MDRVYADKLGGENLRSEITGNLPAGIVETKEQSDLLYETQPWLRRLPTPAEMKMLRAEAQWNPQAAAKLKECVTRVQALIDAAKDDGHDVKGPAFVVECAGKPIGYASIDPVVMLTLWMHSKYGKPRTSMMMLNQVENEASRMGYGTVVVPCSNDSPFRTVLDRGFGYTLQKEGVMFLKNLR